MHDSELKFLLESYSWKKTDTVFHLLQHVENESYRVETPNGKYILRRYRQGRHSAEEVSAELEWMDALSGFITVPKVVRNADHRMFSRVMHPDGEHLYAVFEFVDGYVIEKPTSGDYHSIGQLMRKIHISSETVLNQATTEWPGWNRPRYDLGQTVETPLRNLLDFGALSADDRKSCAEIAEELRKRFAALESYEQFIHADLHFGNILVTPDKWYCLDFDECGFGHRAVDIGVVQLHLKNKDKFEEHWAAFLDGYGIGLSRGDLSLGTAVRIFYMAGKIPKRQDIEDLRREPAARIRRYLNWVERELR